MFCGWVKRILMTRDVLLKDLLRFVEPLTLHARSHRGTLLIHLHRLAVNHETFAFPHPLRELSRKKQRNLAAPQQTLSRPFL